MTKPAYFFWFEDRPAIKAPDTREHLARLLWSYRTNRQKYEVSRIGFCKYRIALRGTNINAIIERI